MTDNPNYLPAAPGQYDLPSIHKNIKGIGFDSDQIIEMIALHLQKYALENTKEGETDIIYTLRPFYNKNTQKKDLVIQGFAISDKRNPIELVRRTRKPIIMSTFINEMKPMLDEERYDDVARLFIRVFIEEGGLADPETKGGDDGSK